MRRSYPIIILFVLSAQIVFSQSVIGVWRGKISRGLRQYNMELKLVRLGDSLAGTSYYYAGSSFARFSVKGSMTMDGDLLWWDEKLLESKGNSLMIPNKTANLFAADFNCPGNDIMKLDGNAVKKDEKEAGDEKPADVHLSKVVRPVFNDEWDEVIGDWPSYAAQPKLVREIARTQGTKPRPEGEAELMARVRGRDEAEPVKKPVVEAAPAEPRVEPNVEEMFTTRKKVLVSEIPVNADSILLRFYDHAEIDGDSIALFLNGKLLHKHVLLTAEPLEVWIQAKDLNDENELTMVAENLGTIPPNTSLMIAWCKGIRYEAKLESTENTSASIKLVKKIPIASNR